jgi:hypothetical protein
MHRVSSTRTGGPSLSGRVRASAWSAEAEVRSLPLSNTNQSPPAVFGAGADQSGMKDAGRIIADKEKETAIRIGQQAFDTSSPWLHAELRQLGTPTGDEPGASAFGRPRSSTELWGHWWDRSELNRHTLVFQTGAATRFQLLSRLG